MEDIRLNLHLTAHYSTVEEARMVGQAVEKLVGTGVGITITRGVSVQNLGLHPTPMNPDLVRHGGQEVDAEINSLITGLRKAVPVDPEVDLSADVKGLDGKTYMVDYAALLRNFTAAAAGHLTSQEAKETLKNVVAEVKWNQVNRTLR